MTVTARSSSRLFRICALLAVSVILLTLLTACGGRKRKPRRDLTIVSFRLKNLDHHWNMVTKDSGQLSAASKAVVLSPNLLFGANNPTAPISLDGPTSAWGQGVSSEVSALLLTRLEKRGVAALSPALGQRLGGCKDSTCAQSTWVEHTLMTEAESGSPATGILAVERLQIGGVDIPIIVREGEDDDDPDFIVRQRTNSQQSSLCDSMTLYVPGSQLMAEFVETESGRVLARFDEAQFYRLPRKRRTIETDFGDLDLCDGIRFAFDEAVGDDRKDFNPKALSDKLFKETLDRIF